MTTSNGNGGGGASVRDPETDRARLRAVHGALTAGDIEGAGKLAEDALADGIDHAMILNLVAGRREAAGRLDEALALLDRALAAAPEAIGVMNARGLVLNRLGRFEDAAEAFGAAVALQPGFAPALANRGTALLALGRATAAQADFEAAAVVDPANLIALDGRAALALRRGEAGEARRLAEQVLAREPGWPGAVLTLAGADVAEGRADAAEAALGALLGGAALQPADLVLATGLRGDALAALGRHDEALAAWTEANGLQVAQYRADFAGRTGTLALVRALTATLDGRRVPAIWGHGGRGPAKSHVFLAGFPGSGTGALAAALAKMPDVALLADRECLIDSARDWLADAKRFASFCDAGDDALDAAREAYWRRVAEAGAAPAGKTFVDANMFNLFKLPLIARLFPDARVVIARRDPRDAILAAFRARLAMSDPAWAMLTLDGAAQLHAAAMALVAASETAFGLFTHGVELERLAADQAGELQALAGFLGLPWAPESGAAAMAEGLPAGTWRQHEAALAAVLPMPAAEEAPDSPR